MAAVVALYLLFTGLYASLGYLGNLEGRIAPYDSVYYYIYLPSLVNDGDLDFGNELARMVGPDWAAHTLTSTGLPGNHWSVGPALLWAPGYLLAHGVTLAANVFGASWPADGYGPQYTIVVYILRSLYAALGLVLTALLVRRFTGFWPALLACAATLAATQLAYYVWPHTALAHAPSFFAVALFYWLYLRKGLCAWTVAAAGLMFLVRWQDLLYAAPLAVDALVGGYRALRGGLLLRWAGRMAGYAVLFVLLCLPQMISWKILYGSFVTVPSTSQKIDFWAMRPWHALFNMSDGLLSWHPVVLLGFVGLGLLWKRDRGLSVRLWLAVLAQLAFIASLQWSSGGSFGMRFFTGGLVLTTLGLGVLLQEFWRRKVLLAGLCALVLLLALFNQLTLYQYQHGLIPHSEPLTWKQYVADKFRLGAVRRAEAHFRLGRELLLAGSKEGFYQQMLRANALDPGEEKRMLALGMGALFMGDYAEASETFASLRRMRPDVPLYVRAVAAFAFASGDRDTGTRLLRELPGKQRETLLRALESGGSMLGRDFEENVFKRLSELQY